MAALAGLVKQLKKSSPSEASSPKQPKQDPFATPAFPVVREPAVILEPGRTGKGQKVDFSADEKVVTHMPEPAAQARKEVIATYTRKADILGHYKPDWEQSVHIDNNTLNAKYTADISDTKLTNTLGLDLAQQHKDTRSAKFVMDNTTFLSFDKVATTNGWNESTAIDKREHVHREKQTTQDALKWTSTIKKEDLKKYTSPLDTYKQNLEATRAAKRAAAADKAQQ